MKILKCFLVIVGIGVLASTAGAASLDVNAGAALNGTNYGLVIMDGTTTAAFVKDDTPAGETVYRVQFWFDVNTWDRSIRTGFSSTVRRTRRSGTRRFRC